MGKKCVELNLYKLLMWF